MNEQTVYIESFSSHRLNLKVELYCKNALRNNNANFNTDKEKLIAILSNLVKNALKYSEKGAIELGYNIITAGEGEKQGEPLEIEFYVKDAGIGIPLIVRRQYSIGLYRQIFQIQGLTRGWVRIIHFKAYVEMLGGKIWVKSVVGEGSVFYFTIPYNAVPDEKTDLNISRTNHDMPAHFRKLKVLIAEDDETSEMLISNVINAFSKVVLKVSNGLDAIEGM
ncbi:MAG: hypothetical protein IPH20_16710 [Bacteroidales bacterium]|nr:hypothetical protein [Bacteroidales bacterium]